jgi:hemolysin III
MRRKQTLAEEAMNAISHGVGLALAIAALPILVYSAAQKTNTAGVVGVSLFASSAILLYFVSTLYHALPAGKLKHWFNRLDHSAIYLFIAGSYMPFLLGVLRGPAGWTMFGLIWAAAAVGVVAKMADVLRHPLLSTGLYVLMGWMVVFMAVPLYFRMPTAGLLWLVGGGVAYTAGAVVYLFDSKLHFGHFVWHLFVLAGSTCHFFAALYGQG